MGDCLRRHPRNAGCRALLSMILVLGKSDPECPCFTATSQQTELRVCATFVAKLAYDNANMQRLLSLVLEKHIKETSGY